MYYIDYTRQGQNMTPPVQHCLVQLSLAPKVSPWCPLTDLNNAHNGTIVSADSVFSLSALAAKFASDQSLTGSYLSELQTDVLFAASST